MKNKRIHLIMLFGVLLAALSLHSASSDLFRNLAVSISSFFWQTASTVKSRLDDPLGSDPKSGIKSELLQLEMENQQLKNDLALSRQLIQESLSLGKAFQKTISKDQSIQKRMQLLQSKATALPAKVIYRPPSTWSSSLWIDLGESTNRELGHQVIAKNSPVTVGNTLIGAIDYVGQHQSRVRLITDSGLSMSVRAARGDPQNERLSECIDLLLTRLLVERDPFFASVQEQKKFLLQLRKIQKSLQQPGESFLLAKGELNGNSNPLWRSRDQRLKGVGFNYDFADDEGPARDLRTGIPVKAKSNQQPIKLLEVGDLLVTTGLDGVFPAGLLVAEIATVSPLQEGDYAYELTATPVAGDLGELSLLYVHPPVGYDEHDQPSGWEAN